MMQKAVGVAIYSISLVIIFNTLQKVHGKEPITNKQLGTKQNKKHIVHTEQLSKGGMKNTEISHVLKKEDIVKISQNKLSTKSKINPIIKAGEKSTKGDKYATEYKRDKTCAFVDLNKESRNKISPRRGRRHEDDEDNDDDANPFEALKDALKNKFKDYVKSSNENEDINGENKSTEAEEDDEETQKAYTPSNGESGHLEITVNGKKVKDSEDLNDLKRYGYYRDNYKIFYDKFLDDVKKLNDKKKEEADPCAPPEQKIVSKNKAKDKLNLGNAVTFLNVNVNLKDHENKKKLKAKTIPPQLTPLTNLTVHTQPTYIINQAPKPPLTSNPTFSITQEPKIAPLEVKPVSHIVQQPETITLQTEPVLQQQTHIATVQTEPVQQQTHIQTIQTEPVQQQTHLQTIQTEPVQQTHIQTIQTEPVQQQTHIATVQMEAPQKVIEQPEIASIQSERYDADPPQPKVLSLPMESSYDMKTARTTPLYTESSYDMKHQSGTSLRQTETPYNIIHQAKMTPVSIGPAYDSPREANVALPMEPSYNFIHQTKQTPLQIEEPYNVMNEAGISHLQEKPTFLSHEAENMTLESDPMYDIIHPSSESEPEYSLHPDYHPNLQDEPTEIIQHSSDEHYNPMKLKNDGSKIQISINCKTGDLQNSNRECTISNVTNEDKKRPLVAGIHHLEYSTDEIASHSHSKHVIPNIEKDVRQLNNETTQKMDSHKNKGDDNIEKDIKQPNNETTPNIDSHKNKGDDNIEKDMKHMSDEKTQNIDSHKNKGDGKKVNDGKEKEIDEPNPPVEMMHHDAITINPGFFNGEEQSLKKTQVESTPDVEKTDEEDLSANEKEVTSDAVYDFIEQKMNHLYNTVMKNIHNESEQNNISNEESLMKNKLKRDAKQTNGENESAEDKKRKAENEETANGLHGIIENKMTHIYNTVIKGIHKQTDNKVSKKGSLSQLQMNANQKTDGSIKYVSNHAKNNRKFILPYRAVESDHSEVTENKELKTKKEYEKYGQLTRANGRNDFRETSSTYRKGPQITKKYHQELRIEDKPFNSIQPRTSNEGYLISNPKLRPNRIYNDSVIVNNLFEPEFVPNDEKDGRDGQEKNILFNEPNKKGLSIRLENNVNSQNLMLNQGFRPQNIKENGVVANALFNTDFNKNYNKEKERNKYAMPMHKFKENLLQSLEAKKGFNYDARSEFQVDKKKDSDVVDNDLVDTESLKKDIDARKASQAENNIQHRLKEKISKTGNEDSNEGQVSNQDVQDNDLIENEMQKNYAENSKGFHKGKNKMLHHHEDDMYTQRDDSTRYDENALPNADIKVNHKLNSDVVDNDLVDPDATNNYGSVKKIHKEKNKISYRNEGMNHKKHVSNPNMNEKQSSYVVDNDLVNLDFNKKESNNAKEMGKVKNNRPHDVEGKTENTQDENSMDYISRMSNSEYHSHNKEDGFENDDDVDNPEFSKKYETNIKEKHGNKPSQSLEDTTSSYIQSDDDLNKEHYIDTPEDNFDKPRVNNGISKHKDESEDDTDQEFHPYKQHNFETNEENFEKPRIITDISKHKGDVEDDIDHDFHPYKQHNFDTNDENFDKPRVNNGITKHRGMSINDKYDVDHDFHPYGQHYLNAQGNNFDKSEVDTDKGKHGGINSNEDDIDHDFHPYKPHNFNNNFYINYESFDKPENGIAKHKAASMGESDNYKEHELQTTPYKQHYFDTNDENFDKPGGNNGMTKHRSSTENNEDDIDHKFQPYRIHNLDTNFEAFDKPDVNNDGKKHRTALTNPNENDDEYKTQNYNTNHEKFDTPGVNNDPAKLKPASINDNENDDNHEFHQYKPHMNSNQENFDKTSITNDATNVNENDHAPKDKSLSDKVEDSDSESEVHNHNLYVIDNSLLSDDYSSNPISKHFITAMKDGKHIQQQNLTRNITKTKQNINSSITDNDLVKKEFTDLSNNTIDDFGRKNNRTYTNTSFTERNSSDYENNTMDDSENVNRKYENMTEDSGQNTIEGKQADDMVKEKNDSPEYIEAISPKVNETKEKDKQEDDGKKRVKRSSDEERKMKQSRIENKYLSGSVRNDERRSKYMNAKIKLPTSYEYRRKAIGRNVNNVESDIKDIRRHIHINHIHGMNALNTEVPKYMEKIKTSTFKDVKKRESEISSETEDEDIVGSQQDSNSIFKKDEDLNMIIKWFQRPQTVEFLKAYDKEMKYKSPTNKNETFEEHGESNADNASEVKKNGSGNKKTEKQPNMKDYEKENNPEENQQPLKRDSVNNVNEKDIKIITKNFMIKLTPFESNSSGERKTEIAHQYINNDTINNSIIDKNMTYNDTEVEIIMHNLEPKYNATAHNASINTFKNQRDPNDNKSSIIEQKEKTNAGNRIKIADKDYKVNGSNLINNTHEQRNNQSINETSIREIETELIQQTFAKLNYNDTELEEINATRKSMRHGKKKKKKKKERALKLQAIKEWLHRPEIIEFIKEFWHNHTKKYHRSHKYTDKRHMISTNKEKQLYDDNEKSFDTDDKEEIVDIIDRTMEKEEGCHSRNNKIGRLCKENSKRLPKISYSQEVQSLSAQPGGQQSENETDNKNNFRESKTKPHTMNSEMKNDENKNSQEALSEVDADKQNPTDHTYIRVENHNEESGKNVNLAHYVPYAFRKHKSWPLKDFENT